ncbi:hypothetical protein [Nocardia nova]|uniref:hypothetical protein n=1 Tax=Nocardia nova TaxID=37330 RepID=UPI0033DAC1D2
MGFGADPARWHALLDSANEGSLTLDPETGRGLDKVCDDYLDQLDGIMVTVGSVRFVDGFGTLPSGRILRKKFEAKATGSDAAIEKILKDHIESARTAKAVVAKAIANFTAVDQDNRDRITQTGTR